MSLQEFTSDSSSKTGGKIQTSSTRSPNSDTKVNKTRPSTGIKANTNPQGEDGKSMPSGKLLLEKQIEERKRKNAERKAAVEDRRRQKEQEDMAKSKALRQLLEHKTPASKASARKLPTVPHNGAAPTRRETSATRRLSSSSSSSEGHTPPGSGKGARSTRRNLTGPTSVSTSSLNSFGNSQHLGRPQTNLSSSKRTSVSTNNLNDGGKTGQRAKETGSGVTARRSVGANIPKAQSIGAIHHVGGHTKPSRPPSGKKTKAKPKPTHHAGTSNEAEAGKALAEHRKKMREEAERKALLDKEKQEELRKQREEEERKLAEEKAKEMARQAELLAELEKQEEERTRLLREDREKEAALEAEKLAAEVKRKEELEVLKRQELERRAAEAERREKEEEERLRREEIERQERRKRVEMIMNRTRMTSTAGNNMSNAESYSSLEDLSVKLSDECHSNTVSEILQKMKEKSRASPSPEKDLEQQKENEQISENSQKDSVDGESDSSAHVFRAIDNSQNGIDLDQRNLELQMCVQKSSSLSIGNLMKINGSSKDTNSASMDNRSSSKENECSPRDIRGSWRGIDCTSTDTGNTARGIDCCTRDTGSTLRNFHDTPRDSESTLRGAYDTGGKLRGNYSTSRDVSGGFDGALRSNDGSLMDTELTSYQTNSTSTVNDGDFDGILRDNSGSHRGISGSKQDAELWANVEQFMFLAENEAKNNLEKNGFFGEDLIDDEDGEEGQLWKVVEGKRRFADVI